MTFLSLGWLLGLPLVLLPIIIHLLNRFRHRAVDWAAMDFLLKALSKQRRRLEMETLILLAVRTLAVLLLVLAMARPLATGTARLLAGSAERRLALLVDNSASMAATSQNGDTLLASCVNAARETVERVVVCRQADLIAFADKTKTVFQGSPSRLVADAEAVFGRVAQGYGKGSPAAALDRALKLAESAPEAAYTITLFTDAQRSNWRSTPASRWQALARRALELENTPALVVVVDRPRMTNNPAIVSAEVPGWSLMSPDQVTVSVQIANHGTEAGQTQLALYDADNLLVQPRQIDLGPGQSTVLELELAPSDIQTGRLRCELSSDAFEMDNRRFLVFNEEMKPRILIVNGEPASTSSEDEVFRLKTLLAPKANGASETVGTRVIASGHLASTELQPFQAVVLANVRELKSAESKQLADFVTSGGYLIVFLGDRVNAGNYNKILFAGQTRLIPAKLKKARTTDPLPMRIPETPDDILSRLRRFGMKLNNIRTHTFFEIDKATLSDRTTVLATFADENSSPAVLRQPVGRGFVVLITTTADTEWGNLPLDPSGAILIHELIAEATQTKARTSCIEVGQPIRVDWTLEHADGKFTVTDSRGTSTRVNVKPRSGRYRLVVSHTEAPGFYEVASRDKRELLAANISPDESDMSALSEAQIQALLPGLTVKVAKTSAANRAAIIAEGEQGALWPALVAIALGLFVAELAMAQHFSRMR